MKRVLITGGLGVIGSRLGPYLRSHGYEVYILDNKVMKRDDYIRADVTSMVEVMEAFKRWDIDCILHLAGEVGRENGELFARRSVDVNVSGTINLIQLCRQYGAAIVFASSSEVYGDVGETVMHEDLPPGKMTNCYALSKSQAEQYLKHFSENYDLRARAIRIFMCYGPGEYPSYYRSAMTRFVYNLMRSRPVKVHRRAKRSWCYIDDICAGWESVIRNMGAGPKYDVFNIGRHDPCTMRDVAEIICQLAGRPKSLIQESDLPPFVSLVKNASFDKAKRLLGYEAKVDLEEGIRRTVEWQKEAVHDDGIEC